MVSLRRPLHAHGSPARQEHAPSGGYFEQHPFQRRKLRMSLVDVERYPMRDLKSDWKRWSRAERVSAIAIVAVFFVCGSSIVGGLTGGSGGGPGFLPGTSAERSSTHGSHSIHQ